jgi:hypothetical protein
MCLRTQYHAPHSPLPAWASARVGHAAETALEVVTLASRYRRGRLDGQSYPATCRLQERSGFVGKLYASDLRNRSRNGHDYVIAYRTIASLRTAARYRKHAASASNGRSDTKTVVTVIFFGGRPLEVRETALLGMDRPIERVGVKSLRSVFAYGGVDADHNKEKE